MSRLLIIRSWQPGVFMAISTPKYVTPEMIPKLCSEESLLIATLWWWWWWWETQSESAVVRNVNEMFCTVLAKVWNVNKKLADSGRAGAFVRRQAACLSSYCLQRYLFSEQKGVTNSRAIADVWKWHWCMLLLLCGWKAISGLANHTMWYFSWSVKIRSPLGPSHLILWALGGDFPLVNLPELKLTTDLHPLPRLKMSLCW
jgi:hypothetical protein